MRPRTRGRGRAPGVTAGSAAPARQDAPVDREDVARWRSIAAHEDGRGSSRGPSSSADAWRTSGVVKRTARPQRRRRCRAIAGGSRARSIPSWSDDLDRPGAASSTARRFVDGSDRQAARCGLRWMLMLTIDPLAVGLCCARATAAGGGTLRFTLMHAVLRRPRQSIAHPRGDARAAACEAPVRHVPVPAPRTARRARPRGTCRSSSRRSSTTSGPRTASTSSSHGAMRWPAGHDEPPRRGGGRGSALRRCRRPTPRSSPGDRMVRRGSRAALRVPASARRSMSVAG